MPKRRFSALKRALALSRPVNDSGQATGLATVAALSPAGRFQSYRKGDVEVLYPRQGTSLPGELLQVSINPFAKPIAAENRAIVKFSKRVSDKTEIAGFVGAANHVVIDPNTADFLMGYTPAKAVVTQKGTANTPQVSKITGKSYKKKGNVSYSIPFGAATGKTYLEVKADFITVAKASTSTRFTISFNNEEI